MKMASFPRAALPDAEAAPSGAIALPLMVRAAAEAFGTFWLVLGGCGSAVLATQVPGGIGLLGVSIAFGLSLFTMAASVGPISGCHLNPAVTAGLWTAGRFSGRDVGPYVLAQVAGAIGGAMMITLIAQGLPHYSIDVQGLAQNGYGAGSPGGYSMVSAWTVETVLTFGFLIVILGVTGPRSPKFAAPLAIGMTLTLIHLISIPVTNTSVNPARSTGPALLVGGLAIRQLWLFWLAPLAGAIVAGGLFRAFSEYTRRGVRDLEPALES
jgi:aquaporin Z